MELLWAYAKRHVSFHLDSPQNFYEVRERYDFECSRTPSPLTEQIRMGWSGGTWEDDDLGTRTHKPVDAVLCKKFFRHAMKMLHRWILASGPPGSAYYPVGYTGIQSNFQNVPVKLFPFGIFKLYEIKKLMVPFRIW